jgi:acylphosphatase
MQHEVCYSGTVQGVGFRYTARSLAAQFGVTGFVRNLSNGQVQLVVEGDDAEVSEFLQTVKAEMGHYIRDVQETVRPASGRFRSFDVRH